MKTAQALSMAVLLLLGGCGGKDIPSITMDVPDTGSGIETVDGGQDVCTPTCEGKQCGDDDCGGVCGTCVFQLETCSEDSQCIPAQCQSTKDCPGALVCDKDNGQCVICVGDEDCPEGQTCGADFECHEEYLCQSDLDCKNYGMVCDKDAGQCVDCLGPEECPAEQYCLETYCVDDVCTAGESHCDGLDIVTCNEDGSAEDVTETCTDTQYCEDGECHAQVCPPGSLYCEDNLLHTCDPIGKEVIDTVDCVDDDKVCHQGECVEQECEPNSTWCHDDFTAAACLEDGMSSTTAPCGADHYCEDGACKPQVCEPGTVFCDGEVYKVCNDKGSAVQYEEDCTEKDQHCFNGSCIDTECPPNQEFCKDDTTKALCSEDGMSSTPEACPAEHYCVEGDTVQCLPWVCTPAEAFCEDNTAMVCNSKGSAIVNEIPCGDNVCVGGACKPVICDANTSSCDGNAVMQCDATGTVEQELEVCGNDQYCEENGDNAQCKDQVCSPGEKFCQGSKVMLCNNIGSASSEDEDCADNQQGCKDGECVDQICSPNATYCDGNIVKKCNGDGTFSSLVETCGEDQYCGEDGNAAACANQVCTPNTKTCQGTKVMECDDVGAALEEFKDCADDGEGCGDGVCVEQICSSIQFNGTTDFIDVSGGVTEPFQWANTKFVEMWVYIEREKNGLFIFGTDTSTAGGTFRLLTNESGKLGVNISIHVSYSDLTVPLHEWTYVFAGWDKAAGKYLVGKLENGELVEETFAMPISKVNSVVCWIGKSIDWYQVTIQGRIDQVRLWSTIPSHEQLMASLCGSLAPDPPLGLVAEWNLDEGQGTLAQEAIQDFDGQLQGGQWIEHSPLCAESTCFDGAICGDGQKAVWEECDDGNTDDGDGCSGECKIEDCGGLAFDGDDDHLVCGSDPTLLIPGDLTIELAVKFNQVKKQSLLFFGGGGETEQDNIQYQLRMEDNGQLFINHEYGVNGDNNELKSNPGLFAPDEWLFLTVVRVVADKHYLLFKDGQLFQTLGYTVDATGGTAGDLLIAAGAWGLYKYYFTDGQMAMIRIWDRAFSPDEVATKVWTSVAPAEEDGLSGYWEFDEQQGNSALDISGNNNHCTLHGPTWVQGPELCGD